MFGGQQPQVNPNQPKSTQAQSMIGPELNSNLGPESRLHRLTGFTIPQQPPAALPKSRQTQLPSPAIRPNCQTQLPNDSHLHPVW